MESPRSSMSQKPPKGTDDPVGRRQRTKRLGDHLRRMYDSVASEGAPDDFLKLLDEADKNAASKSGESSPTEKSTEDFINLLDEAEKSSKKD